MKINFLTTKLSGLTGGVIYDEELYKKLCLKFPGEIHLIEDFSFGNEFETVKPNFRRFNKIYQKHAQEIFDCDYLIINSRLYTRFITFPWKLKGNCKILLIHHHFNFMTHDGILRMLHKYFELGFMYHANKIITPNPYTKDIIKKIGVDKETILIEAFILKDLHLTNHTKENVVLFVGTVEPRKGLQYGIEAFKIFSEKHPNFLLKIAGTIKPGNYMNHLLKIVNHLNLEGKVIFLGRVDEEQKQMLYKESKCFLFPSQNEGYGWVLIEAMSYGLPVIAFNNTAMPYTVNDKNGRLVSNKNVQGMADALSKLVDDPSLYQQVVRGAIDTVKKLPDFNEIENEYQKFYKTLEKD